MSTKDQAVQVTPDMIRRSRANLTGSSSAATTLVSSNKKKKLSQPQNHVNQVAVSITSRGNSVDETSAGQLSHQQPAKKKQRSASIPVRIIDDEGDSCESLCPASPAPAITILLPKDFLSTTEDYEVVNMRDLDVPRLKKQIDVLTPDCDTGTSGCKRTPKLSLTSFENSSFFTENGISRIKNTSELIEVPSFRILNFTPLTVHDDGDEMLDDETFNRRHAKMEIDERRRKRCVLRIIPCLFCLMLMFCFLLFLSSLLIRWDMQRLREQKHTERLKQGRYYSSTAFVHPDAKIGAPATDLKADTEMISFFPDPMDGESHKSIPTILY
jgi:hypothetical protein